MRKIFFILGFLFIYIFLFYLRLNAISSSPTNILGGYFTGIVSRQPEASGGRQILYVDNTQIITRRYPEYKYGDQIKLNVINSHPDSPTGGEGSLKILYYPEIELLNKAQGNPLLEKIYAFREQVVNLYQRLLPPREAGLLAGMVLGAKSNLPYDFKLALQNTQTIHVVVASGQNITYVIWFLVLFLNLFLQRRWAIGLSFIGVVFYMVLAGFEAPIVRAGLMGMIAYGAGVIGRQAYGIVSLITIGFLMLLINPLYILDLGFQLSFGASLGLILFQPLFKGKIFSIPLFGEGLSTTLSAQVMVFPIIALSFGVFNIFSLFINAIILWVVPIVMGLGGLIIIFSPIPILSQILAFLAYGLLWYFSEVVVWFNNLNWGQLLIKNPSIFLVLGYYLLLSGIILHVKIFNKK